MAVPKRKVSKQRKRKRRSHDALPVPTFARCDKCEQPIPPHTVCTVCGFYSGRVHAEVIDVEGV